MYCHNFHDVRIWIENDILDSNFRAYLVGFELVVGFSTIILIQIIDDPND